MDAQPEIPPARRKGGPSSWERTVFRTVLVVCFFGSGLYVFKSCLEAPRDVVEAAADKASQLLTNAGRSLAQLAGALHQNTLTLSIESTGTRWEGSQYLQFERVTQTEIFTHSDLAVTAFGYLPLPEVIVEARAPVEYTYYLDLQEPWRLVIQDRVVHAFTPPVRVNKPSVDISRLRYEVKKDSVWRDADVALENLKRNITSLAALKARENLPLVRETGRPVVADFVQQWLLRSFVDGSNYVVRVHFPGDPSRPGIPEVPLPEGLSPSSQEP